MGTPVRETIVLNPKVIRLWRQNLQTIGIKVSCWLYGNCVEYFFCFTFYFILFFLSFNFVIQEFDLNDTSTETNVFKHLFLLYIVILLIN